MLFLKCLSVQGKENTSPQLCGSDIYDTSVTLCAGRSPLCGGKVLSVYVRAFGATLSRVSCLVTVLVGKRGGPRG